MDADKFRSVAFLPDPIPGPDDHYKSFDEVYQTPTSERFRPSNKPVKKVGALPFSASKQHVKNIDMMLQCAECDQWRLLYSKFKYKQAQKKRVEKVFEDIEYTCGSSLGKAFMFFDFKKIIN